MAVVLRLEEYLGACMRRYTGLRLCSWGDKVETPTNPREGQVLTPGQERDKQSQADSAVVVCLGKLAGMS